MLNNLLTYFKAWWRGKVQSEKIEAASAISGIVGGFLGFIIGLFMNTFFFAILFGILCGVCIGLITYLLIPASFGLYEAAHNFMKIAKGEKKYGR